MELLHGSGVPGTFPHETVLGGTREFLAFRAHRFRQACLPFAFLEEAVERSASQRLAVLANRFACARFLRHCRAHRQGHNHSSDENSSHGFLSHRRIMVPVYSKVQSLKTIALSGVSLHTVISVRYRCRRGETWLPNVRAPVFGAAPRVGQQLRELVGADNGRLRAIRVTADAGGTRSMRLFNCMDRLGHVVRHTIAP
jgi:hypothetical protein